MTLRVRWLGRVRYADAHALQRALFAHGTDDHLLLLEHHPVYTLGVRASMENVLVPPASVGAELIRADRGGDVTFHGPGQLVGYPILTVAGPGEMADTPAYVATVEQVVIDALADLGLPGATRIPNCPGVWVAADTDRPRKICAIGVRLSRGRSMHGFALNVSTDLGWFDHIVPCGIRNKGVTSLAAEGVHVTMRQAVDAVAARAAAVWGAGGHERQDVAWRVVPSDLAAFTRGDAPVDVAEGRQPTRGRSGGPASAASASGEGRSVESGSEAGAPAAIGSAVLAAPEIASAGHTSGEPVPTASTAPSAGTPVRLLGRLAEAGVDAGAGLALVERKPEWLRVKAKMGGEYRSLKATMRSLDLVTVCEEAGCPNIFECWADGTATFMINGERCTRACGFCLVDTRKPLAPAADEPERVAEAVARMGLAHAVITTVARDDLADGGAGQFAATIAAVRRRSPGTRIEVLISDCKGDPDSLATIFDARPDVLNHNLETVARLQRAVRPSASYARSLAVLGRAKDAGLVTKSGLIVGMGETDDEVRAALADLAGVGVDIVTVGQYLRPTAHHLPVARWWAPEEFDALAAAGTALGIAHVEASPLTRSSYHARQSADAADAARPAAAAASGSGSPTS